MARTIGEAGRSVREMQKRRRQRRYALAAVSAAGVLVLIRLSFLTPRSAWCALIAGGLIIGTMLWLERRSGKVDAKWRQEERRAGRGADGEERVGDILGQLPDDHIVLHDIVASYGNIDHVVLAPRGVFAVETKSHRGRVTSDGVALFLNGRRLPKDPIRQALRNALWLRDRIRERTGLEVFVQPLLVFSRGFIPRPLPRLKGVFVTESQHLNQMIGQIRGRALPVERLISALTAEATAAGP
jgi:hypothetical protein